MRLLLALWWWFVRSVQASLPPPHGACLGERRYEGEFQVGYAHGLGQFTSENRGEVYIGEFFAGQRHG